MNPAPTTPAAARPFGASTARLVPLLRLCVWLALLLPAALSGGESSPPPFVGTQIGTVSPRSGPLEGGTVLTIDGAKLKPGADIDTSGTFPPVTKVFVGGREASNVTVFGTTRLTAVTPPGLSAGEVDIVVQNASGTVTNRAGFTYGTPRGTNLTLITSAGGQYSAVVANDTHLFVGQGNTFQVFDLLNRTNPTPLASLPLPHVALDIAVEGNLAVVATEGGIQIVDISQPAAPRLRGRFDGPPSFEVKVLDGRAYVAPIYTGLVILDLANPDAPVALSVHGEGLFSQAFALKRIGNGLYAVFAAFGRVIIMDVTNPQAPTTVAEFATTNPFVADAPAENVSLALVGTLAFVGQYRSVEIIDLTDPAHPVEHTPRLIAPDLASTLTVAASGNTVAYADNSRIFQLIEVSGQVVTPRGQWEPVPSYISFQQPKMVLHDGMAWLATGSALVGVTISDPDSPQPVFHRDDLAGHYLRVAATGNAVFGSVINQTHGFTFAADTLTHAATFEHPTPSVGMAVAQGVLLDTRMRLDPPAGDGSAAAYRVSVQPDSLFQTLPPALLAGLNGRDAEPAGDHVVLAATEFKTNHVVILEVDPSRTNADWILRQTSLPATPAAYDVEVAGAPDFLVAAFVEGSKTRLNAFSWNSSTPRWALEFPQPIFQLKLSHANRYLHVGTAGEYRIYDLADPANPNCLSTNVVQREVRDVVIEGDEAYLALWGGGIQAYDITDKAHPQLTRSYATSGAPGSLAKVGDRLFVASYHAGIQVLGLTDITPPQVTITNLDSTQYETALPDFTLGGTATDKSGQIRLVIWRNDRGADGVAVGTTNWLTAVSGLSPGLNHLEIIAYDHAGNSSTTALAVTYTPHPPHLRELGLANGQFRFEVIAFAPGTILLQRTTDFIQWESLGFLALSPTTSATVEIPASDDGPHFYRAIPAP